MAGNLGSECEATMRVPVTGGAGFVGRATVRARVEAGKTVANAIRWWAEHDSIDRGPAGKLASRRV